MNNSKAAKRQKGFFDLGISLAILAIGGTLSYATTPNQDERAATHQSITEVVATIEAGNDNRSVYE